MKTGRQKKATKKESPTLTVKDTFLEFLLEQLSGLGNITVKSMFSGKTLFCDGVVFALIDENVLYLKADSINRSAFEALGIKPFKPFKDQPGVMQYYPPPPDVFEDQEALLRWCSQALDAGRRAKRKKKPK